MDIIQQFACLLINPIMVDMVSSLIARRLAMPQTQQWLWRKAFIRWLVSGACLWLGQP